MRLLNLVSVLAIALLLAGCDGMLGGGTDNPELNNPDLYKGTEGLTMELVTDIPEKFYEDDPFDYVVKFTNKGVYEIKDGVVSINLEKGYLSLEGGGNVARDRISLDGKVLHQNIDDFEIRKYSMRTLKLDETSQSHDVMILVNFCYDYMAKVFTDVCIDSDPHGLKPQDNVEKACVVKNIDTGSGQGGPVSVTGIDARMIVDSNSLRPQFTIHVQNHGEGAVIEHGAKDVVCSSDNIARDEYNKVLLSDITLSDFTKADFDCTPEPLRLRGDSDFITCTLKEGRLYTDATTYSTPLYIELKYGYLQSHSDVVRIESIFK